MHSETARQLNALDGTPRRQVWFQFWDTHLTYERSYWARIAYVHHNAVHHGLVHTASRYRWCSAAWFEREADSALYRRVTRLPIDGVVVPDAFTVTAADAG